jgi:hypothetical protein
MRDQLTFSLLINVRRIKNIATADQNSDRQTARPFAWTGKLSEMILSKAPLSSSNPLWMDILAQIIVSYYDVSCGSAENFGLGLSRYSPCLGFVWLGVEHRLLEITIFAVP